MTHSTARVARGEPLHVLRHVCDEADATLLALGGRHSSRFLGIVMGDTATELLHDGTCSVLIARPQAGRSWKPASVVVGLDGSASALAALATTDELAARLGATVEVVSATGDESPRRGSAWGDKVDTWDPNHPVAALVERSREADLIVVGSRGLHGLRALGSISERVAHQARCSVLVVHQTSPADHLRPTSEDPPPRPRLASCEASASRWKSALERLPQQSSGRTLAHPEAHSAVARGSRTMTALSRGRGAA